MSKEFSTETVDRFANRLFLGDVAAVAHGPANCAKVTLASF